MRISKEAHKICPQCGVEANGLDDIDRVFGYEIVKDVISPRSTCRECRNNKHLFKCQSEKQEPVAKKWATADVWGKRIHISRSTFDSYLIELGYLECDPEKGNKLVVTEKGKNHCSKTDMFFREILLWDFETFAEVAIRRAEKSIVHDVCPMCKAYLDTMPDYDYSEPRHNCRRCGRICDYWHVNVIYDR